MQRPEECFFQINKHGTRRQIYKICI